MSSITFLEQQQEVASICKLDISKSNIGTLVQRWLNIAQDDINSRGSFPWQYERKIIQTVADKTDGTIAIAVGGTVVTGTGTAFASTDVGSFIQFSNADDWYKISVVTSDVSITIETAFAGSTALTAGTYTIRKYYYSLGSDVEKVLNIRQSITPAELAIRHFKMVDNLKPNITSTGNPTNAYIWGLDSDKYWQVSFYPIPDSIINMEVRYKLKTVDLSAATDVTRIPQQWAKTAMIYYAIWRALVYNVDPRADKFYALYDEAVQRMIAEDGCQEEVFHRVQNADFKKREPGINYPDEYEY